MSPKYTLSAFPFADFPLRGVTPTLQVVKIKIKNGHISPLFSCNILSTAFKKSFMTYVLHEWLVVVDFVL